MPSFSRLLRRWTSTRRTNARRRAPSSSDVRAPDEAPVPGYDRVAAGYGLPPGYEVAMRGMPPRYVEKTSGEDPAAASAKPPRYQRVQASSVLDDLKHEIDTLSRQMEQELSREFKSDLPNWRQTAALRASSDEQFREFSYLREWRLARQLDLLDLFADRTIDVFRRVDLQQKALSDPKLKRELQQRKVWLRHLYEYYATRHKHLRDTRRT